MAKKKKSVDPVDHIRGKQDSSRATIIKKTATAHAKAVK